MAFKSHMAHRMINTIDRMDRKTQKRDAISTLMNGVNNTEEIVNELCDLIPKLYTTQQNHHGYMNKFIDQLKSTYISSAQLDNPFSNPEDPFAEFCHAMGTELSKFELIEKDYLQRLNQNFVKPIKQFKQKQFREIYPLHLKYKRILKKYNKTPGQTPPTSPTNINLNDLNTLHELNETKFKLETEINRLKIVSNGELLNDIDLYWNSFISLCKTRNNIISRSQLKDDIKDDDDIKRGNNGSDDDETKFEVDFDIDQIDDDVGFNNINNDIQRYTVKRIQNAKSKNINKKSMKYNRVIYIDSTLSKQKKIKLLSLKKNIRQYILSDIEKVEKSYLNINVLNLKFKDKKEYRYEFESPSKREQFVGQILEYDKYKGNKLMSIVIGSYNVGESECNRENIKNWLHPSTVKLQHHDLYVIGLQEVKSKLKKNWISNILAYIDDNTNEYLVLANKFLMGIGIIIIIHHSQIAKISHIQSQTVATGKGNIIGNKGAAAISFQFMETTFLFVNCHLAARAERFEKRAKNFYRIVKELKIGNIKNVDILHQFQHVFWFGDLNYRIEKEFNQVIQIINQKKWENLLEFDQLYHAMNFDAVFSGFTEGKISFCPTYRWSKSENIVSNKRNQPPSYTDRILYRSLPNSLSLWQETYTSAPNCFGSDHRPIISIFKFKPRIPYFSYSFRRKYSGITISFVELKAQIKNAKIDNNNRDGKVDILFSYIYSSPTQHKLIGGKYDTKTCYFRWPMIELDDLKIEPFVSDPSFLCTTHISLSFLQKNTILGHSVISLFNAFPSTLLDTEKLKQEYMIANMQMDTMKQININSNNKNKNKNNENDIQSMLIPNHKGFKIVISKEGAIVGELEGFISVDGKMIRKHMRYSTMDAHKRAKSPEYSGGPHTMNRRKRNNKNNKKQVNKIQNGEKLIKAMKAQSMHSFSNLFGKNKNREKNYNQNQNENSIHNIHHYKPNFTSNHSNHQHY